nr:hypothetical protein CFP56_41435 [Quercus suber]
MRESVCEIACPLGGGGGMLHLGVGDIGDEGMCIVPRDKIICWQTLRGLAIWHVYSIRSGQAAASGSKRAACTYRNTRLRFFSTRVDRSCALLDACPSPPSILTAHSMRQATARSHRMSITCSRVAVARYPYELGDVVRLLADLYPGDHSLHWSFAVGLARLSLSVSYLKSHHFAMCYLLPSD